MSEEIRHEEQVCYLEGFPHSLPHRNAAVQQGCGHLSCDAHAITYFGTGEDQELEGDYCLVCFSRQFPSLCPDPLLRTALGLIGDKPSTSES